MSRLSTNGGWNISPFPWTKPSTMAYYILSRLHILGNAGLTVSKFCYGFFMLEMAFDRDRDLRLYGQKKRESIRPCKRPRQPICTVLRLASYWAHSSEEKLKDRILESWVCHNANDCRMKRESTWQKFQLRRAATPHRTDCQGTRSNRLDVKYLPWRYSREILRSCQKDLFCRALEYHDVHRQAIPLPWPAVLYLQPRPTKGHPGDRNGWKARIIADFEHSLPRAANSTQIVNMKLLSFFLAAATVALAQDSVSATGAACEPHGDHWCGSQYSSLEANWNSSLH